MYQPAFIIVEFSIFRFTCFFFFVTRWKYCICSSNSRTVYGENLRVRFSAKHAACQSP